jgi:hypothetical protein
VKNGQHEMAKAKVGAAGIEYIQGALKRPKKMNGHNHGNYLVATHRIAPTENPDCQRLYTFDSDRYKRSTPVTTEETRIRNRFSAVAAAVSARAKDLMKISADQAAFAAQKDAPNGKKTMRAFLWKLEKEAYDAEHNG